MKQYDYEPPLQQLREPLPTWAAKHHRVMFKALQDVLAAAEQGVHCSDPSALSDCAMIAREAIAYIQTHRNE